MIGDKDWRTSLIVWAMLTISIGGMPLGIGLAIYTDNPAWLLLTVFSFCVMYAG